MTASIEDWFWERPAWLQTAAALRLAKATLEPDDYEYLALLCLRDAGEPDIDVQPLSIHAGLLDVQQSASSLRLKRLGSIVGVNALRPARPLDFGDALTVIYGDNGSGKSGYARLLKHISGARFAGPMHGDAFDGGTLEQSATLVVMSGGNEQTLNWRKQTGPVAGLPRLHVFDSECAAGYLMRANEPAHEPFIVRLFAALIVDCDRVESALRNKRLAIPSKLPLFPDALRGGAEHAWYAQLSATTSKSDIDKNCSFSTEQEGELVKLESEFHAATTSSDNAADLKRRLRGIEQLERDLRSLDERLSEGAGSELRKLKRVATDRRFDATTRAKQLFSKTPLVGVGEDAWRRMWEAAREYSEKVAYIGRPFPVEDDAVCVLCQQTLLPGNTLREFERFVKDALEDAAEKAEQLLATSLLDVPAIPALDGFSARFEAVGCTDVDAVALHQQLSARRTWVLSVDDTSIPETCIDDAFKWLRILSDRYASQLAVMEEIETTEQRTQRTERLRSLRGLQWLSQQRVSIETEVERLRKIARIELAIHYTSTQPITRKKNDLSEELLADRYDERFNAELTRLQAQHLPIRVEHHRAEKALKPGFELKLKGEKRPLSVPSVLSEGEARVVALASFLADVTAGPSDIPFIFDDPISSLDHTFEEATARRLVAEAKVRQVIVFTHRLSFVAATCELAERQGIPSNLMALRASPEGKGTPGETFIRENNPISALKRLLNDRVPKVKKAFESGDSETGEVFTRAICADLRVLIERLIERVLMNDVIERFRRKMHTQAKLQKLALIERSDCDLLDRLMTAYSFEEHSQPNEAPVGLPDWNTMSADLKALIDWAEEFKTRIAP